jgi:hypothetical protein
MHTRPPSNAHIASSAAAAAAAVQARQAFGLGSDVFVASNLDAHEATIKELGNFAAPFKAIEKATGQFNQDTAGGWVIRRPISFPVFE